MTVSALLASFGPQVLAKCLEVSGASPEQKERLHDITQPVLDALVDGLQTTEHERERLNRADFLTELAGDLLRNWRGDLNQAAALECVRLARVVAAESYAAAKEPF